MIAIARTCLNNIQALVVVAKFVHACAARAHARCSSASTSTRTMPSVTGHNNFQLIADRARTDKNETHVNRHDKSKRLSHATIRSFVLQCDANIRYLVVFCE